MSRLFIDTVSAREAHAVPIRLSWVLFFCCLISCSFYLAIIWHITNLQGDFVIVKHARWIPVSLLTGAFLKIFLKESEFLDNNEVLLQKLSLSYSFILMALSSSFFIASHYIGIYSSFTFLFLLLYWIGISYFGFVKYKTLTQSRAETKVFLYCSLFMEILFYLSSVGLLVQIAFILQMKDLYISVISFFCFLFFLLSINFYNLMFYKIPNILRTCKKLNN